MLAAVRITDSLSQGLALVEKSTLIIGTNRHKFNSSQVACSFWRSDDFACVLILQDRHYHVQVFDMNLVLTNVVSVDIYYSELNEMFYIAGEKSVTIVDFTGAGYLLTLIDAGTLAVQEITIDNSVLQSTRGLGHAGFLCMEDENKFCYYDAYERYYYLVGKSDGSIECYSAREYMICVC